MHSLLRRADTCRALVGSRYMREIARWHKARKAYDADPMHDAVRQEAPARTLPTE